MLVTPRHAPRAEGRRRRAAVRALHARIQRIRASIVETTDLDAEEATRAVVRVLARRILANHGDSASAVNIAPHGLESMVVTELEQLTEGWTWAREHDATADPDALTPELLGLVFEQLVNGLGMGAYYTPPDITAHLVATTVLTAWLDLLESDDVEWGVIARAPERFVRADARHGLDLELPAHVAKGVADATLRDDWNTIPPPAFALPGETWRETIERRSTARTAVETCARGEVRSVDALIANNLDVQAFAHAIVADASGDALARMDAALCALRVLDLTCGSGAFLVATFDALWRLARHVLACSDAHVDSIDQTAARLAIRAVHGVDIMGGAAEISSLRLRLALVGVAGPAVLDATPAEPDRIRTGNALVADFSWRDEFHEVFATFGGFHAIVGNPPFLEHPRAGAAYEPDAPRTRSCANLAAHATEVSIALLVPGGRLGLVLPVSTIATERFGPLQSLLAERLRHVCLASFDTIPSSLFVGVVQRVVLLMGATRAPCDTAPCIAWGTRYRKWRPEERDQLASTIAFQRTTFDGPLAGSIPKFGAAIERDIFAKLATNAPLRDLLVSAGPGQHCIFYKRRWSYFLLFLDFEPEMYDGDGLRRAPSELKTIHVDPAIDHRAVLAVLNSSLFYLHFSISADNRNVNRREIEGFPLAGLQPVHERALIALAQELMVATRLHSELRECTYRSIGTIRNQYFFQGRCKPIIDRIDAVLAEHYGLNAFELDHVQSFELRFRVSAS